MSAITVNRAGFIVEDGRVVGCLKGGIVHYSAEGMGTLGASAIGSVERVEVTGPRGGSAVEWIAHSPHMDVSPAYRTRTDAVSAVVDAWSTEPVEDTEDYASAVVAGLAARGYVFTVTPTGGGCVSVSGAVGGRDWHITDGDAGLPDGTEHDGATALLAPYGDDGALDGDVVAFDHVDAGRLANAIADVLDGFRGDGGAGPVGAPSGPVGGAEGMGLAGAYADAVCAAMNANARIGTDPVTGVTEADKARYGSVMAARGARMSHTVTGVENVRGTWNVNATADDGTPELWTVTTEAVRWYARGGECVLSLPVGVTFPDTGAGAVEAVRSVMSGPVQWADGVEAPEGTPCDAFGRGCGGTYGADRVCGTCRAVHASVTPADMVHADVRSIPGVESTLSRPFTESAHVVVECGGMDVTVTAVDGVWTATFDTDGFDPVHVPLTSTGSVNGVGRIVRDYVESRSVGPVEVAPGVHVVESRAGDYVEVNVDGEHHVYTWTEDRGVVRDYLAVVDCHVDYGNFRADPVGWVRAYYADDTDDAETEGVPESNGTPLGAVARAALDAVSGETDVYWTPTESGTGDVSAVVWACGDGGDRNTFRVGVFMSDAGTVFNGMDGAGDYDHTVTDDVDDAVSFIRNHLELEPDPGCVMCGESVDHCPGHGWDNYAAYVWAAHDADYHGECRASCRTEGARGVLIVSREYDPDTDVNDGAVYYAETWAEWHPDVSVLDAVDYLNAEHLTTDADAHGPDVWTEGDARGERVDYRTGVVTETEAYLRGYTDAECAVIAALATGGPWECGGVTVTGVGFRVWDVGADEVDADAVPWFRREDYPDADADDAPRFIPLSDGDYLPLSDVMALRDTFAPGASVMEPDNVHRVLHGASTDSAWSGYGVIHDYDDDTWSVVRMTW